MLLGQQVRHRADALDPLGRDVGGVQGRDYSFDRGGHEQQPTNTMSAEGPGNVARVESIGDKHRAADHKGRDTVLGSAHVKHRGPGDKAVVCVDIKIRAQQRHARDQGALADHGGFGRTAGATGVENQQP